MHGNIDDRYSILYVGGSGPLLIDILAGLYISSVFFVTLWYEEEEKEYSRSAFVVTQTCFNRLSARSSPCFTVVLAAWAKKCSTICHIWSVIVSERKTILLLFAFYALCHIFWRIIIITKYYCCWFTLSLHIGVYPRKRTGFLKAYHSRFNHSTVSPDCKYLEDGDPALNGPVSLLSTTSPLPLFMRSPHLSSLSGCVSNIVQCNTQKDLLGSFLEGPVSSPHIPPPNHSLFFYIFLCIHVQCFFCSSCGLCLHVKTKRWRRANIRRRPAGGPPLTSASRHISLKLSY